MDKVGLKLAAPGQQGPLINIFSFIMVHRSKHVENVEPKELQCLFHDHATEATETASVDTDSLRIGLIKLNCSLSTEELREVIMELDTNGDGNISPKEWHEFVEKRCADTPSQQNPAVDSTREVAMTAWEAFETTSFGLKTAKRLCSRLSIHGLHATFTDWDWNGDGVLDVSEIEQGIEACSEYNMQNDGTPEDSSTLKDIGTTKSILVDILMDGVNSISQELFADGMFALAKKLEASRETHQNISLAPRDPIKYLTRMTKVRANYLND